MKNFKWTNDWSIDELNSIGVDSDKIYEVAFLAYEDINEELTVYKNKVTDSDEIPDNIERITIEEANKMMSEEFTNKCFVIY